MMTVAVILLINTLIANASVIWGHDFGHDGLIVADDDAVILGHGFGHGWGHGGLIVTRR